MPHSGGSSTNAGIRYQNWFLALQFSYAFYENGFDIYPESLFGTSLIDDIYIKVKDKETYFSIKYSAPNSNLHWSQSALKKENILLEFKKQFEANPTCEIYLVSECNCYLFAEVFNRARNFYGGYGLYDHLDSKKCIEEWEKVKAHLDYDDLRLLEFSKRVYMKVLPLSEIISLIKHRFSRTTSDARVEHFLFDKAIESSANKLRVNKMTLNKWFHEEGIKLR